MTGSSQQAYYWLLDVRNVWAGTKIDDAAPQALSLLSQAEAARARGFHFLKDAKLSLGSSLLKRLFATTAVAHPVPWADASFGRRGDQKHGKPCLLLSKRPGGTQEGVPGDGSGQEEPGSDFNISHQAGLVALAGVSAVGASPAEQNGAGRDAGGTEKAKIKSIGVDIVCVNERNDARSIERHGFDGWVDMHEEVFSDADVRAMKAPVRVNPSHTQSRDEAEILKKMRRFYAYWALKEAYVKMEGEALLAGWLREVEFRGVDVPDAVSDITGSSEPDAHSGSEGRENVWGEATTRIEVYLKGQKRHDVELSLQAFEGDYMIATSVVKEDPLADLAAPKWKILDLERDIYPFAV